MTPPWGSSPRSTRLPQSALAPYITPYHYGYNAPTMFVDPSGAGPWCVVAAVGAAVGGAVGGAIVGGVSALAGPAAGTAARAGFGLSSTGVAARGMAYGITAAGGATGTQAASLSRGDGFASAGDTLLGAGGAALGRGVVDGLGAAGVIGTPHGMNTLAQMRVAAPRNIRNFASGTRNWNAMWHAEGAGLAWGLLEGGGRAWYERQQTACAKC